MITLELTDAEVRDLRIALHYAEAWLVTLDEPETEDKKCLRAVRAIGAKLEAKRQKRKQPPTPVSR